jgi:DHA1 family arabinose polymer transporter-like MFS transporter
MYMVLFVNMFITTNPYLLMGMTFIIGVFSFTISTPIQMAIINTSKGSEMLGSSMNQSALNMGNALWRILSRIPNSIWVRNYLL